MLTGSVCDTAKDCVLVVVLKPIDEQPKSQSTAIVLTVFHVLQCRWAQPSSGGRRVGTDDRIHPRPIVYQTLEAAVARSEQWYGAPTPAHP